MSCSCQQLPARGQPECMLAAAWHAARHRTATCLPPAASCFGFRRPAQAAQCGRSRLQPHEPLRSAADHLSAMWYSEAQQPSRDSVMDTGITHVLRAGQAGRQQGAGGEGV